jgi:hypothetical protein
MEGEIMGFWDNKKTEKVKEVVVEEETMVETEDYTCDDCGKDFKESDLNEDGYCKACVKKQSEKEKLLKDAQETYAYTFAIEFSADEEGNEDDPYEYKGLTELDAKKLYDNVKTALKNKEEYFEIPVMDQYDAEEEEINTLYPEYIKLSNVKKAYYNKTEE